MNFAFFGTDEFSVKVLDTLKNKGLIPSLIVTVPDKPQGRKMVTTPPLAKVWGDENKIPVIQPASLRDSKSNLAMIGGWIKFLTDPKTKEPSV